MYWALAWAAAVSFLGGAAAKPPPNFLVILVDNLGYGDLGRYGNGALRTPAIDRLAQAGVRCTDFYVASPSCSPSRGGLLTGRHPERNGLNYQLSPRENTGGIGLPVTEQILPEYLAPLGYVCGAFGKWNIGFAAGARPLDRGFHEFFGHASGNIHYFKHLYHGENDLRQGNAPVDRRGEYATDLFADAAIDFLRRHRTQPFFLYLAFNAVHFVGAHNVEPGEAVEWQVPGKYLARHSRKADDPDPRRRFAAVVTALDDATGRVLAALDELGLTASTLVVFLSDNGAFLLPGRGLEVQSNSPLRGGGVTTYEGGIRVPAIFRWPGRLPAGAVCRQMLSSLDLVPLLVHAANGELPRDRVFDGRDPADALSGKAQTPHDALYWVWDQGRKERWRALRWGSWKIVRRGDQDPWQLYDLSADVAESHNLAAEKPALVQDLARRWARWQASIEADPTRSHSTRRQ